MNELRIAAAALLIIVATPLIVSLAWPTGTSTEDVYTVEEGLDVTPALATSDIPVIDVYNGPNNNRWLYALDGTYIYNPIAVSKTPSSLPDTVHSTTTETVTTIKTVNLEDYQNLYRVDIRVGSSYISVNPTGQPGDGDTYDMISYYPATSTIYGYTVGAIRTISVTPSTLVGIIGSNVTPVQVFYTEHQTTGDYVDMPQGFRLNRPGMRSSWGNGLVNHSVTWWVKSTNDLDLNFVRSNGSTYLKVANTGSSITANGAPLGSPTAYPYIQIEIGIDAIKVTGVAGANSFVDNTFVLGKSIELSGVTQPFQVLEMFGTAIYEVKGAMAEIGVSKGIHNGVLTPYNYYSNLSWQITISNVAAYGRSITFGVLTYPVIDGIMCQSDGTPIAPVNGMRILSLAKDGNAGQQLIYVNDQLLSSRDVPSSTYYIQFMGDWYADITVSDVTIGTQTSYTWDTPNFGLDTQGYCMVGMITSILTMIAAGLYGRRTGTHALIVLIVGLIACGTYYMMI